LRVSETVSSDETQFGADVEDDLRVYSADPSRTHTFTFYFLDSHAYKTSWKSPFSYLIAEYDFIKP
jgi:hypothetical protein